MLGSRLTRKLVQLDAAYGLVRHITMPSAAAFLASRRHQVAAKKSFNVPCWVTFFEIRHLVLQYSNHVVYEKPAMTGPPLLLRWFSRAFHPPAPAGVRLDSSSAELGQDL